MTGLLAKTRKGQASTEMLATVGIVLLLLIPVLFLLLVGAQVRFESLSHIQAASASRLLADSINEVYLEGKGATKVALINLPSNTKSVAFSGKEVVVTLATSSGDSEITYPFFGELSDDSKNLRIEGRKGIMPVSFRVVEKRGEPVVMVSYEE